MMSLRDLIIAGGLTLLAFAFAFAYAYLIDHLIDRRWWDRKDD